MHHFSGAFAFLPVEPLHFVLVCHLPLVGLAEERPAVRLALTRGFAIPAMPEAPEAMKVLLLALSGNRYPTSGAPLIVKS